ncbi:hypothetical protein FRX31_017721 [Thalictrum thalictroides]|uniref:Uncharacterized protein n=1 Tax=Thalictrum thalictroides TaxID=46969 RepID=A0A7J6W8L8_THATH|nr:hypothetical protein FRX31_017721 [Thalictrum thalictroides]
MVLVPGLHLIDKEDTLYHVIHVSEHPDILESRGLHMMHSGSVKIILSLCDFPESQSCCCSKKECRTLHQHVCGIWYLMPLLAYTRSRFTGSPQSLEVAMVKGDSDASENRPKSPRDV